MRLLPFALLALALAAPLAAAAEVDARPGVLVPFQDGDTLTWRGPLGADAVLSVRAGEAPVRVRWLSPEGHPHATRGPALPAPQGGGAVSDPDALSAHGGFSTRVNVSDGKPLSLAFSGGPGFALVSSWTMAEEGSAGNGTVATLRHEGTLAPGECVAQSFGDSSLGNVREGRGVLRGRAVVEAGGPGLRFRLHDAQGRVLGEAPDALGVWLPQETLESFDAHTMHLQACAPEDAPAPRAYVLRVTRVSEGEPAQASAARAPVPLPPALPLVALLVAGFLARRRAG